MSRRVGIAIGVGWARPLPYLAGAINGALGFADWTASTGCEAHAITDRDEPVTIERLRAAIASALEGPPIQRLYLYFAGHGFIRDLGEGLWLLSDWRAGLRAVATEMLRRRLYRYGIEQIAIFSDACRNLPPDVAVADLTADAVLGDGPKPFVEAQVDKFFAVEDGNKTFMVPGAIPELDRCLFSGVLLEALWGTRSDAFSRRNRSVVINSSLGTYLRAEVPRLSARYGKRVVPTATWMFPEEQDVYYDAAHQRMLPTPAFAPWPALIGGHGAPMSADPFEFLGATPAPTPEEVLLSQIQGQRVPDRFETSIGFAVEGLVEAWSPPDIVVEPGGDPTWWRIRARLGGAPVVEPVPLLIQLTNGTCAALTCLPKFIAGITPDRLGIAAVVYREVYGWRGAYQQTEQALALLASGTRDAATFLDAAVDLRVEKHVDPMLGVISAYLYDAIGDLDSVRRMAYFYVQHGQAIPYDIALLAHLDCVHRSDVLIAQVPAVKRREARTDAERRFDWTTCETEERTGVVGGLWPWLRQGWAYLEPDQTMVHPALPGIARHLTPSRFTALDPTGRDALRAAFGLVPAAT